MVDHATSWPSNLPKIGINGVGSAYIGLDINSPNSPIYSYWAYKWPKDYSKWYYDVVLTYDWSKAKSSNIDFAGIIVIGKTVSWSDLLGISSSQVDQYGLPQLDKISSQPYIWLRDDATFYIDNCFWVNGKQTTWNSQVPKVESGKVVTDIYFTDRWSTFPDEVVEAIYGWVSGSKYYGESAYGYWQIPCDAKLSFTFAIDGHKYVLEEDALIAPNPWGDKCIGSIFTKGQAVAAIPTYDIIFGFQFREDTRHVCPVEVDADLPMRCLRSLVLLLPCWCRPGTQQAVLQAAPSPYPFWRLGQQQVLHHALVPLHHLEAHVHDHLRRRQWLQGQQPGLQQCFQGLQCGRKQVLRRRQLRVQEHLQPGLVPHHYIVR